MPPYHEFLYDSWVESTLASLSPRKMLGQLLHVAGWSNRGQEHTDDLLNLIEHYGIGGIIFFQGTPERQLELTRKYQNASKIPLLISIDAEWGLGMRLDQTLSYPHQIALGAIQDNQLIYDMGRDLGEQCRRMGIHMNFAPCVDVNTEAANPVIGFRSFGSDPELVARKARAYMDGLQDAGILAVAKHFPGHGNTRVDSHFDLPTLSQTSEQLEKTELQPFRELIRKGVSGVMPGHLHVPALDDTPNVGATLSRPIIDKLLRRHLNFKGLVVTDALDMKGVTKHFPPGEIELKAFLAGNDMLLFPSDVRVAIMRLEKALEQDEIELHDLRSRCRHILAAKRWADAGERPLQKVDNLHEDLHKAKSIRLVRKLHQESLAWYPYPARNTEWKQLISFVNPDQEQNTHQHHQLNKGQETGDGLAAMLQQSGAVVHRELPEAVDKPFLLSIEGLAVKAKDRFGLSEASIDWINRAIALGPEAIVLFASPYAMTLFTGWESIPVLHAFQNNESTQLAAAEVLLGQSVATGRLSVDLGEHPVH